MLRDIPIIHNFDTIHYIMNISLTLVALCCFVCTANAQSLSTADSMLLASLPSDSLILVEEEPKPMNMGDIQRSIGYPQTSRDAGLQGVVIPRVLVDSMGNYVTHTVIKRSAPSLTIAVEKEIHKLKFTPAIQDGKAIPFWVNIPFNFKLLDNSGGGPIANTSVILNAQYPIEALEKRISGQVVFKGKKNMAGKMVNYEVVKSDHPSLQIAAEYLLTQIRFRPRGSRRAFLFTLNFDIYEGETVSTSITYRM